MRPQERALIGALIGAGIVVGSASCGTDNNVEDYGIRSASDLVLTRSNHPHGYGKIACFNCHVLSNIHQVDRIGSGALPTARALVARDGLKSCAICHGENGVKP